MSPLEFRGQLMLQISAGRFFRPGVEINEYPHRRTVYTNVSFLDAKSVELPVGTIIGSDEHTDVSTAMLEAIDRLEARRLDGTDEFLIATNGDDLIDDIAYVMTFVLNRTFSRNHAQVHRLVSTQGTPARRRTAASLFPQLFDPAQVVQDSEWGAVKIFMTDLLELSREDFARVMRVIRNTVDATRRAIDDPTGSYTDIVAALESLGEHDLAVPTTWDRYDGAKRKIIDAALEGLAADDAARVRVAVLEADRAGLKRHFVTSTLARVSAVYYRDQAIAAVRPPRAVELEQMLSVAYNIRSRRSHVLQDLGDEAWGFADGAETTFDRNSKRILTLAGLWRLTRHVVHRFVADAGKTPPEPWDYRGALPGQIQVQLAPQFWIGLAEGFNAKSAPQWFNGAAEAMISWRSDSENGFNLTAVIEKIEQLVPGLADGEAKTAMVATYILWHEWLDPKDHRPGAADFTRQYGSCLDTPSPTAFTVGVLARDRELPGWTTDEWASMALNRRTARQDGKALPLPATIDALIHLEASAQLEAVGRHEEAKTFASYAVDECPGHAELMAWEARLLSGDHNPEFDVHLFLFGKNPEDITGHAAVAETTDQTETE